MANNNKETNKVIAEFRDILEKRGVAYELNNEDANMIRFRTQLPNYEKATPFVLIHFNEDNGALSLALSGIATFTKGGPDLYAVLNDFNADPGNFGCKMFVETDGHLIVLTNAIIKSGNVCDLIEEYLKINILATDKFYSRISEIIENGNKD
ncbi:hypothetical protein [Ruminococcus flavefaciens]|uniref:hypothetical protein n=1 Tax=Ruminococcus flavefaciens TaxID=1265 RepID=UPI001567D3B1|nr:hypothetical protein [Ruminococcus flavefaciens]